ncbi:hypothetical protein [Aestuariivirga sp.]|uniref:hypothetical protein n=1 Tax=Aestuariivirga sp. TaxID=2650926 RepID=UPI0039E5AB29
MSSSNSSDVDYLVNTFIGGLPQKEQSVDVDGRKDISRYAEEWAKSGDLRSEFSSFRAYASFRGHKDGRRFGAQMWNENVNRRTARFAVPGKHYNPT